MNLQGDDDSAAPAQGTADREHRIAVQRANYGGVPESPPPPIDLAEGTREPGIIPTLALDPAALEQLVEACRAAGVGYGVGKKVPEHGALPGVDFGEVDASGFVREAVWRATEPHQPFPDGAVVQREYVEAKGFRVGMHADGLLRDGGVRIAFLRPEDAPGGIGHVALVHDAKTYESHDGAGPDSRPWTDTGWQAKTLVFVLTPPA
ncbi:MAG: hypothetical protein ACJ8GN_30155 [Longimicrobiaceae bacterium]